MRCTGTFVPRVARNSVTFCFTPSPPKPLPFFLSSPLPQKSSPGSGQLSTTTSPHLPLPLPRTVAPSPSSWLVIATAARPSHFTADKNTARRPRVAVNPAIIVVSNGVWWKKSLWQYKRQATARLLRTTNHRPLVTNYNKYI